MSISFAPASWFTTRASLLWAAGASVGALCVALFIEFGLKMPPCHWCMIQRYPYAVVALGGLFGAFFATHERPRLLALSLCAVLFLLGTFAAFWHAGIERGWVQAAGGCVNQITGDLSLEQMREQIRSAPLVACDQPMLRVLGLSLAEWNAALYAFLTILASYASWLNFTRLRKT